MTWRKRFFIDGVAVATDNFPVVGQVPFQRFHVIARQCGRKVRLELGDFRRGFMSLRLRCPTTKRATKETASKKALLRTSPLRRSVARILPLTTLIT
jgi:hypothetical protein